MRDYETIVVLVPDLPEEEIQKIKDRIFGIIDEHGEVTKVDEWGVRKLAFKVKKVYTEGYYIVINFKSDSEVLDNLYHYYQITDNIIRYLIVKDETK